jgi:hypothetical protein
VAAGAKAISDLPGVRLPLGGSRCFTDTLHGASIGGCVPG